MPKWYIYQWFIPSPLTRIKQPRYWPMQEGPLVKYLSSEKPHDLKDLHKALNVLAPSGNTVISYFAGDWFDDQPISRQFTQERVLGTLPGILVLFQNPEEATYCKERWNSIYVIPKKLKGE